MYRYDDDDDIYCSTDHEDIKPSVSDGCDIVENAMLSKGEKQEKQRKKGKSMMLTVKMRMGTVQMIRIQRQ